MSDEESVKILQPVSLAMREAVLHLDTHGFGENRARNKRKSEMKIDQSSRKKKKKKKRKSVGEETFSVDVVEQKHVKLQSNIKSDVKSVSRTEGSRKVKPDLVNKKLKKKKKPKSSGV